MLLAALPQSPIRKLVLNDAGVIVPKAALERLASYVGRDPRFASLEELEQHVRKISAPFGPLTDEQWRHLATHNAQRHPDGTWTQRYDPAIGAAFEGEPKDIDLTAYWDSVGCPTLLLRGAQSDLLLPQTALEMTRRGPKAELVEFEGIGHAPMLMCDEQVRVVREFLLR
jgi:pimeloyl-ACP methyl ester carboxylesterase